MEFGIRRIVSGGLALALIAITGLVGSSEARAQARYSSSAAYGQYRHEGERIAFDKGYRRGLEGGDEDARHHLSPSPDRSHHYREADEGYHREYGPIEEYRG